MIDAAMITDDTAAAVVEDTYQTVGELCDELARNAARGDFSRHVDIVDRASSLMARLDCQMPRPALALFADEGRRALAKLKTQLELADVVSRA
jgi:hypothetical protein